MPSALARLAPRHAASSAPPWFFDTPEQRLAWVRQRFFDDGVRPTGVVSEAVLQSWTRCLQAGLDPRRPPVFSPVSAGRLHDLQARHRRLLDAADAELQQLQRSLAGTAAVALLLDAGGRVLHTSRRPDATLTPVLAAAARPGVDLSEGQIGTNAPALAAIGAGPCLVRGAEHFAGAIAGVHCAAAAIRGPDGRVAAVLDISTEGGPFGFEAAQVVAWHATAIENQWLLADAATPLVLRLHMQPAQLDCTLVGMVGLDALGRLAWQNAAATAMLGRAGAGQPAEALLGRPPAALRQLARRGGVQRLQLGNGLQVWLQADWRGSHDIDPPPSAPSPAPAPDVEPPNAAASTKATPGRLRDTQRDLVQRALQACGGNVSAAARQLGVSRGLVYRHSRGMT